MFLFHLTKEDRQKIHQILKQYQEDSRVQSMHGVCAAWKNIYL